MNGKRWYNMKKLKNQIRFLPNEKMYEIQAVKNGKLVSTRVRGDEFVKTWEGKLALEMLQAGQNPGQWVEIQG